MTKKCKKCGEVKAIADFNKKSSAKDGLQTYCKPCHRSLATKWQKDNHERYTASWKERFSGEEYNLRRRAVKYGLTVEQLSDMLELAAGKCSICLNDADLVVDHCHDTGSVRGLLCGQCNTALGLFKDDIEVLKRAINYLN